MADDTTRNIARLALITGSARRIGATIALALARAGYAVVLHANNSREDAERLAAAIKGAGGRASVVLADLADHEAVQRLIPSAAAFGQLSLLVNNAGEFEPDDIETLSHARFQRAVAVNLAAPLFLSQAFAAQAPAGVDASIVNIVDQRVLKPNPRFFSYTLSKSALHTATVTLAQLRHVQLSSTGNSWRRLISDGQAVVRRYRRYCVRTPKLIASLVFSVVEGTLMMAAPIRAAAATSAMRAVLMVTTLLLSLDCPCKAYAGGFRCRGTTTWSVLSAG